MIKDKLDINEVTLGEVIPQVYILDQTRQRTELYTLTKRGLVRTWKIGRTRFYYRTDLEELGYRVETGEERDIPLSELLSRKEAADRIGMSTTGLWKASDWQGGRIETVQFNNGTSRFWLKESVDAYKSSRSDQ
jgi:hypothetical protein